MSNAILVAAIALSPDPFPSNVGKVTTKVSANACWAFAAIRLLSFVKATDNEFSPDVSNSLIVPPCILISVQTLLIIVVKPL